MNRKLGGSDTPASSAVGVMPAGQPQSQNFCLWAQICSQATRSCSLKNQNLKCGGEVAQTCALRLILCWMQHYCYC